MIEKSKHEISVMVVLSEEYYINIVEDFGFDWEWSDNNPLGSKINHGIKESLIDDWDYLMMMNSDDVIDVKLIDEVYEPYFGKAFFGINRVTYVKFGTTEARDVTYPISCLGIGKMIRRDVVENAFKHQGYLYLPDLNKCLDDTMMDNLISNQNHFPEFVQYHGQMAWDFKSEVNIWPWDHFKSKGNPVEYVAE